MGIYECVVYQHPEYGDPVPVVTEGRVWSREVVAETRSKARYSYWLGIHEYYEDIKLTDIRVFGRNRRKAAPMSEGWEQRLLTANEVIKIIAKYGRHFLSDNSDQCEVVSDPYIANFSVDARGELWYTQAWHRSRMLVRLQEWPRFSDGGTLRGVIENLRDHIMAGKPVRIHFAEYWGYGEDMIKVAEEVNVLTARVSNDF